MNATYSAVQDVRGKVLHDASMARYSSWQAGGTAATLFMPADAQDLAAFLANLPADTPRYFVGLGSNLLVRDGGVDGVVVRLAPGLSTLEQVGVTGIHAQAGVAAPKLARFAGEAGLGGAEFMAGIPGSIGGALAMNAGCFGGTTWDIVTSVTIATSNGEVLELPATEFDTGYRQVVHKQLAQLSFLGAHFALTAGAKTADETRKLLAQRAATQPIGTANAGSVFINPADDAAGRLIEAAGLAGKRIGAAEVSDKHCNFIINTGSATASDIEDLIEHVRTTVQADTGVVLVPEVRIIGERP